MTIPFRRRPASSPAKDGPWWSANPRIAEREGVQRRSVYVKAADGTKLAVDLFLPGDLRPGEQVPTLMTQTPYFRAVEFRSSLARKIATRLAFTGTEDFAEACVAFGYGFVLMDLRGSGASHGRKSDHTMRDAARDGSDVIDWVVSQPWSNGRVGATGVSGHGLCAMWQTTARNPALRAIAPRFTAFDNFTATHPGGAIATRFMRDIGALVAAMDRNELWKMPDGAIAKLAMRALVKGIKPVDDDHDYSQLRQAVRDHAGNAASVEQMGSVTFRDDVMDGSDGVTIDDASIFSVADEVVASNVPIYACGGWMDGPFARELINLHNTISRHIPGSRLTIGPWGHGGAFFSSPTAEGPSPTAFDHAAELTRFFDWHLRDVPTTHEEPIHYFTMGEDRWKSSTVWPVPASTRSVYLDSGSSLADRPGGPGSDAYRVDFDHGTGVHSRFGKHLTSELFPVTYPDRAEKDKALLVYDSEPVSQDTEVTGHPEAHLFVSSTADDGLFIVYLEDVAPDGVVRTVADGWLKASARRLSDGEAPYWQSGPHRAFARSEHELLPNDRVVELWFELYPTSWLFRRGHRIRVAIAGADKDNLLEVNRDKSPVITVHRGPEHPSRVELPIVTRP